MFASKVARPQTKAAADSTNKLAPQHSVFATRPLGGRAVEQAHFLQSTIGNQAALRLLSQRGFSPTGAKNGGDPEKEGAPENIRVKPDWDFGKISVFAPERETRPHPAERGKGSSALRSTGKAGGKLVDQPITGNGSAAGPTPPAPAGPTPAPATPPKLTKKAEPATVADCGSFRWVVQWELDKVTTKGGWVVQKVELSNAVKDCDGKPIDLEKMNGLKPSWYPLWEAWQINAGQKVTTYAETGDTKDDTYGSSYGATSKGSLTVKGTPEFYEGLSLPGDFKVTNKAPTWILPSTHTAPTLTGGTGAISHNLTATWDCCGADKKTKVTPT